MHHIRDLFLATTIGTMIMAMLLAGALSGAAAAGPIEQCYMLYHAAMRAAELCADYSFDRYAIDADIAWIAEAKSRIGAYMDNEFKYQIDVGQRLDLIEQAKTGTEMKVETTGCESPETIELLTVFEAELAPLLPPQ
jgi:hypothetical protein